MVLVSTFFCPSEHFSAQLGRKLLPSAFFGFDKTASKRVVMERYFLQEFLQDFLSCSIVRDLRDFLS